MIFSSSELPLKLKTKQYKFYIINFIRTNIPVLHDLMGKNPFKWYFKLFKYSIPTNVIHYCVWVLKCIRYNNYDFSRYCCDSAEHYFRYLGTVGVPSTPYPQTNGNKNTSLVQEILHHANLDRHWNPTPYCGMWWLSVNRLRGTPTLSCIGHWQLIYTPYKDVNGAMDYGNIHKEDLQGGVQFKKFNLVISDVPRFFFYWFQLKSIKINRKKCADPCIVKHVPLCKKLGQKSI